MENKKNNTNGNIDSLSSLTELRDEISKYIRDIPDFPEKGIIFKDITPFLCNGTLFRLFIKSIAERYKNNIPDYVAGIESRGFIFGAALSCELGCGFIPIRKKGKLPYKTIESSYDLEYGSATIEIHRDALQEGDKIIIVDDLLATGGTVSAACNLINKLKGKIIGIEFVIELAFLKGRCKISNLPVNTLITVN